MSKTKKLITGVATTALLFTSACGQLGVEKIAAPLSSEFQEDQAQDKPLQLETAQEQAEQTHEQQNKISLDKYKDDFQQIDLDALQTYINENKVDLTEEELVALLQDIEENGEPTTTASHSAFPWWLFLLGGAFNSNAKMAPGATTGTTPQTNTNASTSTTQTTPRSNVDIDQEQDKLRQQIKEKEQAQRNSGLGTGVRGGTGA